MLTKPPRTQLGELFIKRKSFYMVTGIEFKNRNYHITLTKISNKGNSLGNKSKLKYDALEKNNFKPMGITPGLLFFEE